MTGEAATDVARTPHPPAGAGNRATRTLLAAGAVAGPLFLVVILWQALTREGFEPARHPLSLLSLGDAGWVQITNFIVAGVLFVAAAVGFRRVLAPGPGSRWLPRLTAVFGAGLIAAGVFVADPAFGFPPGTPPGAPEQVTWHGAVHGVAPAAAFLALTVAAFGFARRFVWQRRRGWAAYSLATGVVVLPLSMWPNLGGDPEGRFLPLWVALVVGTAWMSATAARLALAGGDVTPPTLRPRRRDGGAGYDDLTDEQVADDHRKGTHQ
jgi:hypothetical protein